MNIDRWVLRMGGFMVLLSLLSAFTSSSYWLWLTALVGFNLFQSIYSAISFLMQRLEINEADSATLTLATKKMPLNKSNGIF